MQEQHGPPSKKENFELKSQMENYQVLKESLKSQMENYQVLKESLKSQMENYQVLKESFDLKSQMENYQVLKSSFDLKSQMEESNKTKSQQYDMAMLIGRLQSSSSHYGPSSSVVSKAPDHSSNPKGGRDTESSKDYMGSSSSKDYMGSSSSKDYMGSSSSKKESKEGRGEKGSKTEKVKSGWKKPAMETIGPPPSPTNSHLVLLPPQTFTFAAINPTIVSAVPHNANSPHALNPPQVPYAARPPKMPHLAGPLAKMHDMLHHQVSQQYTPSYALLSPTAATVSAPSAVPPSGSESTSSEVAGMNREGLRQVMRHTF